MQKELATQSIAESTTESVSSLLTDLVQKVSATESTSTSQAVSNNDLSVPSSISNSGDVQGSNTSSIHDSGTNTIEGSSASRTTLSDNPYSIFLSVASTTAKDHVTLKKSCDTRVAKTQVNLQSNKGYYTGRIISCPTYKSKETQTMPKAQQLRGGIPIRGRRIIDFDYFFKALKSVSNHSKFGCNLNDIIIENERKIGICSRYSLRCTQCDFHKVIWTENIGKKENVNTDFVSSMLSINLSFKVMNELLATLHLPALTRTQFNKECNKINKKTSEKSDENKSDNNSVLATQKDVSAASDENKILEQVEQVDLGGLLIEDQFEVKEECVYDRENEPESILPDKTMETSIDKMIVDQEQITFDPAIVKHEIDSDLDDSQSVDSTINRIETLDKKSLTENEQAEIVLPQQRELNICESVDSTINRCKTMNKRSLIENKLAETILPQQMETSISENKLILKQTQANLHKTAVLQTIEDHNKSVKLKSSEMKKTDKSSHTKAESCHKKAKIVMHENSLGAEKLNHSASTQGIPMQTAPNIEKNFLEHGLATTTPATNIAGGNYVYLMPVQPMDNSNGSSSTLIASQMPPNATTGIYQGVNSATFMPQTSSTVEPNSFKSSRELLNLASFVNSFNTPPNSFVNNFSPPTNNQLIILPTMMGATYIPSTATAVQQPTNLSNIALNNSGATYIPSTATAVHQPPSLPNVLNNSGALSMPSTTTAVQQHQTSSNITLNNSGAIPMQLLPPAVLQPSNSTDNRLPNANVPRWVGRANMNNNNPFCTLPGGAPKGVSDPVPPRQDNNTADHQHKRQQFRCDDCDLSFTKYESWDSHKKSYCIKRFKLQPSSTVTSHMSMNTPLPSTHVNYVNQPHLKELLSAMAAKRSSLESSLRTALEAQYIINLHKSVQDLTKFRELDDAFNKENALRTEASFEEKQIAFHIRSQALVNAKAAYMQEKYSASAVEQALHRQKSAIEATLTATGHEQAALISTLRGLKTNEIGLSSVPQTPYNNLSDTKSFNQTKIIDTTFVRTTEQQIVDNVSSKSDTVQKTSLNLSGFFIRQKNDAGNNLYDTKSFNQTKLIDTTFVQTTEQQIADNVSSKSDTVQKTSLNPSDFFIKQKNDTGATSSCVNTLQSTPFDIYSEKHTAVNLEKNKAVTSNIPPDEFLQLKKINAISYSNNSVQTPQSYQILKNKEIAFNKLSYDSFKSKKENLQIQDK